MQWNTNAPPVGYGDPRWRDRARSWLHGWRWRGGSLWVPWRHWLKGEIVDGRRSGSR